MKELAKEILNEGAISVYMSTEIELDFILDTNDFIDNYLANITPETYIIMEGAYKDLIEDIRVFLLIEIRNRIGKQIENLDEEAISKLDWEEKEYLVELDGN